MFKKVFIKKSTDWEKYLGIKRSPKQKQIDNEIKDQVMENGVYAIFDDLNSEKEIVRRLKERKNERWKRAGVIVTGFGVLIAIVEIFSRYW